MLNIKLLREEKNQVIQRLKIKNFDAAEIVENILSLDEQKRKAQQELDNTLATSNRLAKEIGQLYKTGKREEAEILKTQTTELKTKSGELKDLVGKLTDDYQALMLKLPNLPHSSVPPGKGEDDNEIVYEEGTIPLLYEEAEPHWELIKRYDIVDFDLGNKVTGAGFPFYKGKGARLQRALINFFLDRARDAGYLEIQPPLVVNEASGYGTGQLPDKDGQMYKISNEDLYLIPTAEVPITNIYRNNILEDKDLPVRNTAYSACFRREAGSWGAHVRGLNRLHQFDKVEIVQIRKPEESYDTLEEMKNHVASLIRDLKLPFRILKLCGGDTSFTAALTFDFEVYSAAQKRWLEVSSVSNFESYQANRMKLRYRSKDGKISEMHTLNGSALALPRIVAALLENNQTPEGIHIPEVLQKYTGFDII
jgi:seryl-tRNA synthetase